MALREVHTVSAKARRLSLHGGLHGGRCGAVSGQMPDFSTDIRRSFSASGFVASSTDAARSCSFCESARGLSDSTRPPWPRLRLRLRLLIVQGIGRGRFRLNTEQDLGVLSRLDNVVPGGGLGVEPLAVHLALDVRLQGRFELSSVFDNRCVFLHHPIQLVAHLDAEIHREAKLEQSPEEVAK
ncbi:CCHC-type domain-containing protein [Mycena indigotica]|uniref:CCHC-type domain-containing protein n=1 Tax=Mycena indigotica TaxID=2126181 RepID=A0A8H6VWX3_9AGAR|nr:CCHC-type domain-containing protein [Mycena indigotica]KAF7296882.1 CCHC-type domain-containing protein [Mycena indigotica]